MRWPLLTTLILAVGVAGLLVWLAVPETEADVVLYCSVDQDQSQGLVDLFRQEAALRVKFQGDLEADKSVGLAQRLSAERSNPQADVFWANEIMNTVWLAEMGAFDPLPKDLLEQFPERWRDPQGRWVGFGLRARVLMVNTKLLPQKGDWPTRVSDLLDPKYAAMGLTTALAAPLTGTTYTHGVALLTRDEAGAKAFLEAVVEAARAGRVKITPSNGSAMSTARDPANKVAFCLTDTDDAWMAKLAGFPVEIVYPDQGEGEVGTFVIPNTLAWVKGRPHPQHAERLLRWIASPATEARLAAGPSAQMPVREGVEVPADGHVKRPGTDFRVAETDWIEVGRNRDRWLDMLDRLFRSSR
jgi:iron(III) transport system substrate-binding protein